MKAFNVTISGCYHAAQDKIIDFSGVTGVIPFQDEEIATMHVRKRYARMWIMNNPKFERIKRIRECYIDNLEETEADFSFVGKDIKSMTYEELQDLATAKDLRLIPLYKVGSERDARVKAYAAYSEEVIKEKVLYKEVGFNLAKQPPLIVNDSAWRKDTTKKMTNDEALSQEADSLAGKLPKTTLSRDELEKIAKAQNVNFHPSISDSNLYQRLYG